MHSAGQNIYRNISDAISRLRSDYEYSVFIPAHHSELEKKVESVGKSSNNNLNYNITISALPFTFTFFYAYSCQTSK